MNEGDLVAGRYRLVRPIGRGAMGTVWAARHELLGRDFALKFAALPARKSSEARDRFLREAQIVGKLRHPNVVDVADFGEVSPGDGLYLAMELLYGESLAERIERHGKLDPKEVLAIGAEITRGLGAAHVASIVHHDIKPENIFLSRGPTGGVVPKLLDFGISKHQKDEALGEAHGHPLGTPAYMSPEQALGELDVDHRTDIWSLGVVLHEMLTGKHPFVAPNYQALMTRIAEAPLATLDTAVPEPVRAIVAKCLEKSPDRRFQTAEELGLALEQALEDLGGAAGEGLVIEKGRALRSLRAEPDAPSTAARATFGKAALPALVLGALLVAGWFIWTNVSTPASGRPEIPAPPGAASGPLSTGSVDATPSTARAPAPPTTLSTQAPTLPAAATESVLAPKTSATGAPRAASSTGKRTSTSVNDPGF